MAAAIKNLLKRGTTTMTPSRLAFLERYGVDCIPPYDQTSVALKNAVLELVNEIKPLITLANAARLYRMAEKENVKKLNAGGEGLNSTKAESRTLDEWLERVFGKNAV